MKRLTLLGLTACLTAAVAVTPVMAEEELTAEEMDAITAGWFFGGWKNLSGNTALARSMARGGDTVAGTNSAASDGTTGAMSSSIGSTGKSIASTRTSAGGGKSFSSSKSFSYSSGSAAPW